MMLFPRNRPPAGSILGSRRSPLLSWSTAHLRSFRLLLRALFLARGSLLAPLDGLLTSHHNAELAFRMEEQAIYGFLGGLQIGNYRAHDEEDELWILQILEGPQDEANLNDCLSGDLHPSPLLDAHHQTERRRSGRRGTRKRRTSAWNPMFFGRQHVSREYTSRKNNSRWTAKEVERLVQGVSKFGVGRWTLLKQKIFKTSIRTAVNLKDKWRNLLKAYLENSQQTTLLHLEPVLVERIRKLAAKQPYANKRHR